ncbi:MAG: HAD hydrolase-like protein [Acidimicrobiia bacterium]
MANKPITIFDLDGTLIDISSRHYFVYSNAIENLGGRPLSIQQYWDHKRANSSWEFILEKSNLSNDKKNKFLDLFIAEIEKPENLKIDNLLPNVKDVLQIFIAKTDCYLISLRRNHENLIEQLKYLGINDYFKDIKSGHTEGKGYKVKSNIINELPVTDYKVLVIGDTESDILAAHAVNANSVAVSTGIRNIELLKKLNPDEIIKDISNLLELKIVQYHINQGTDV